MDRARKSGRYETVSSLLTALLLALVMLAPLVPACEEQEEEPRERFSIGDRIKSGDYILIVKSVTDPYQPEEVFDQPEAGKRCVLVDVVIENGGGGGISLILTDFVLVDAENFVYESSFLSCAGPNDLDMLASLGAGEKTAGTVAFEVPEGSNVTVVKYRIPQEPDILVQVR
jgi:hypothetical protein